MSWVGGLIDRVGVLRPLRIRDFALLWTGLTVSFIGDGVYIIAIAWQTYDLSNSPSALAAVGIAWSLPQVILLLITGVLSDRVDRRLPEPVADQGDRAADDHQRRQRQQDHLGMQAVGNRAPERVEQRSGHGGRLTFRGKRASVECTGVPIRNGFSARRRRHAMPGAEGSAGRCR